MCVWNTIAWKGAFQAMQMDRVPKCNTWSQALICTLDKLVSHILNTRKYQSWPTLATTRSWQDRSNTSAKRNVSVSPGIRKLVCFLLWTAHTDLPLRHCCKLP